MMALLLLITAVPTLLVAIFLILLWRYSYWYRRGVPQGNPLKLFGDLNDITITSTPCYDHYIALSRRFAGKPFYGVYSGTQPRLVIRDPELLKEVMTKKFSSFSENGFGVDRKMEPIMGRDPFCQTGEQWKETRYNFTSIVTPARLKSMFLQMNAVSKDASKYLRSLNHESGMGDGVDAKDFTTRFMINLVIRTILSVDAECFTKDRSVFMDAGDNILQTISSPILSLLLSLTPKLGPYLGYQMISRPVRIFFDKVIKSQKEYRASSGITADDLLETITKKMQQSTQNGNTKVTDDPDLEVLSMVILFFLEGYETTSTAIATALLEIARNVELQEKLRGQILSACPRDEEITEDALNTLPILQNCLLESMRKYPPLVMTQRVATKDVTLQASTGEEVSLKKGSCLNIMIAADHLNPEIFPNPEDYDPERFEDDTQKRYFNGFGDGPRQCPGQKYALLSGRTLMATILREFKLELSPKTEYPVKCTTSNSLLLSMKDVYVRFIPL